MQNFLERRYAEFDPDKHVGLFPLELKWFLYLTFKFPCPFLTRLVIAS